MSPQKYNPVVINLSSNSITPLSPIHLSGKVRLKNSLTKHNMMRHLVGTKHFAYLQQINF